MLEFGLLWFTEIYPLKDKGSEFEAAQLILLHKGQPSYGKRDIQPKSPAWKVERITITPSYLAMSVPQNTLYLPLKGPGFITRLYSEKYMIHLIFETAIILQDCIMYNYKCSLE